MKIKNLSDFPFTYHCNQEGKSITIPANAVFEVSESFGCYLKDYKAYLPNPTSWDTASAHLVSFAETEDPVTPEPIPGLWSRIINYLF